MGKKNLIKRAEKRAERMQARREAKKREKEEKQKQLTNKEEVEEVGKHEKKSFLRWLFRL